MALDSNSRPLRKASVQAHDLPDGSTLLYDSVSSNACPVNESAARIWHACDGETSTSEIVDKLEEVYDAPRETIAADVLKVLARFASEGLLEGASPLL